MLRSSRHRQALTRRAHSRCASAVSSLCRDRAGREQVSLDLRAHESIAVEIKSKHTLVIAPPSAAFAEQSTICYCTRADGEGRGPAGWKRKELKNFADNVDAFLRRERPKSGLADPGNARLGCDDDARRAWQGDAGPRLGKGLVLSL
jgi:hypothetical protein